MKDETIIYCEKRWRSPIFIIFGLFSFAPAASLMEIIPSIFNNPSEAYGIRAYVAVTIAMVIGLAFLYGGFDLLVNKIIIDEEKIISNRLFSNKLFFWRQIKEIKPVLLGGNPKGRSEYIYHILFTTFEPVKGLTFTEWMTLGRTIFSPIEKSFAFHPIYQKLQPVINEYEKYVRQNTDGWYLLTSYDNLATVQNLFQALLKYHPQSCFINNQILDLRKII